MAKVLFNCVVIGVWLVGGTLAWGQTPVSTYDGIYSGELSDATGGTSSGGRCGSGFHKVLRIKSGAFSLAYNPAHNEYIKGTVGPDGSFLAVGASATGGNRFTGKIVGNSLTGEVTSGLCTYTVRLTKG